MILMVCQHSYNFSQDKLINGYPNQHRLGLVEKIKRDAYFIVDFSSESGSLTPIIGGELVVDSASEIAAAFGMSQTLIGLTIVAIGTSLPELVTSVVASTKGENDLAMGNVIGSNIFNILLIIGASAAISPMAIRMESIYDGAVLLLMSIILFVLAKKGEKISRGEAIALLVLYGGYTAYIIMR